MRTYPLKTNERAALGGFTHLFYLNKDDLGTLTAKAINLMPLAQGDVVYPQTTVWCRAPITGPTIGYTFAVKAVATDLIAAATPPTTNVGAMVNAGSLAPIVVGTAGYLNLTIAQATSDGAAATAGEFCIGVNVIRRADTLAFQA